MYPAKFNALKNQLDPAKLKLVAAFYHGFMNEHANKYDSCRKKDSLGKLLCPVDDLNVCNAAIWNKKYMFNQLLKLSVDDPDHDAVAVFKQNPDAPLDESRFDSLFKKYFEEPCAYYVQETSNIFTLAKFDREANPTVLEKQLDFYKAWGQYKLCLSLNQFGSSAKEDIKESLRIFYSVLIKYQ